MKRFFLERIRAEKRCYDDGIIVNLYLHTLSGLLFLLPFLVIFLEDIPNKLLDIYGFVAVTSFFLFMLAPIPWKKFIFYLYDKLIKDSSGYNKDDPMAIFATSILTPVQLKRESCMNALNNLSLIKYGSNLIESVYSPSDQLDKITLGLHDFFKRMYNAQDGWKIRIAQLEKKKIKSILYREPKSAQYTSLTTLNKRNSAFQIFLKSRGIIHIIPDLNKANTRNQFLIDHPADLKDSSLLLYKVCHPTTNEALLIISIQTPNGIQFSPKDRLKLAEFLSHFASRLAIEYAFLQISLYYNSLTQPKI